MKKKIFISVFLVITYYITTFVISFFLITKSVVNNDPKKLEKYILRENLKNDFYNNIIYYGKNFTKNMDKKISIKNESIEFTGELTQNFINKILLKASKNIASDFSNPKIMLYFYFNSKELNEYFNKSFSNFGNYNFDQYISEKNNEDNQNNNLNINDNSKDKSKITKTTNQKNNIMRLIKKIKSTNYFFITSPIHFKIDVKHQDIPFKVILRFNGYLWKLQKIKMPYKQLINLDLIKL